MRTSFTFLLLTFLLSYHGFSQTPKLKSLNKGSMYSNTSLLQDYDSDGDLDIILSQEEPDGLYWLENEPTKQFPKRAIVTQNISNIADVDIADFDKDGDMDYVVCTSNTNTNGELAWYQRQADGTYIKWTIDTNEDFIMADVADFNGDGRMDIAAVGLTSYAKDAKVYLNQGNLFFEEKIASTNGIGGVLDAEDIDGDGDIDIALGGGGLVNNPTTPNAGARVIINDGNANFSIKTYLITYTNSHAYVGQGMVIVDLNNDGVKDIVGFSSVALGYLYFFDGKNNFSGSVIDEDDNIDTGGSLVVFDINGDGRLDIVRQSWTEQRVSVLYQTGNMVFQREYIELNWWNSGNPTAKMAVGDLDKDGDLDLIFPEKGSIDGDVAWFENINGKLYRHYLINQANAIRIPKFADIDKDGDDDILVTLATDVFKENEVMLYENLGNNNFFNWRLNDSLDYAADIEPADIDGDGDIDAFVTARDGNDLVWLRNDGIKGSWLTFSIDANANQALGIKAVDLDKDNDMDVVLCSNNDDKVFWYRNNGGGNFSKLVVDANVDAPVEVEAADLDGDGDIDLALSCGSTTNTVVTYLNNGTQTFTRTIQFTGKSSTDIEIADWDKDGRQDVIFSLNSTSPVSPQKEVVFLIQQANGSYSDSQSIEGSEKGTSLKVVDLDKDGDMDLLVGRNNQVRLVAWIREGDNLRQLTLSDIGFVSGTPSVLGIDVADTDKDGRNDIVFADFNRDELVLASFECFAGPALTVNRKNASCGQNNGTATVSAASGTNLKYVWSTGATTQSIANLAVGAYRVTVTNDGGCQSTSNVVIGRTAVTTLTLTPTNTTCDKNDGAVTVASQGGVPISSYLWNNGAITDTIKNLAGGTYSVVATDTNGCKINGQAIVVSRVSPTVNLGRDTTITQGRTITLNAGGTGLNYLWSTGATTRTITVTIASTYSVTVTNAQGCTATDAIEIKTTTSTQELEPSEAVISPNPTSGQVTIEFKEPIGTELKVLIFDLSGKRVKTRTFNQISSHKMLIDISDLPAGAYLMQIESAKINGSARIIKQ